MTRPATASDLLRIRQQRLVRLLPAVGSGDAQAIHRTRVASRRLRELLPVVPLDAEVTRRLGRQLRKVTRRLGPIREQDVLLDLLREVGRAGRHHSRAIGRVEAAVREARRSEHKRVVRWLADADLSLVADRLARATHSLRKREREQKPPRARAWRWAIEARVARRSGTLADAITDAGAVYLPERLHVVRIATKKLRYAVELRDESRGGPKGPEQRLLRRAQDLLGRMHDLQVLVDQVRQVQGSMSPPDLTAWHELDELVGALEDECRRLHARYMHLRPALITTTAHLASAPVSGGRRAIPRQAG
jgi:CHAD domain-containing protein